MAEEISMRKPWSFGELRELCYWRMTCTFLGRCHVASSQSCATKNIILTSVIIMTSIGLVFAAASADTQSFIDVISSKIFGAIKNNKGNEIIFSNIIIGVLGAISVGASMFALYARYEERHIEHRMFSAEYFNLHKKISRLTEEGKRDHTIHSINKEINSLNKFAPLVPARIRQRASRDSSSWTRIVNYMKMHEARTQMGCDSQNATN